MSETPENAQPLAQFDPRSTRRTAEDDRAWAQLYASVGQASTAEEVVKQLDADAQTRRSHLALYLRAKTTLRERRIADARSQRIASLVGRSRDRSRPSWSPALCTCCACCVRCWRPAAMWRWRCFHLHAGIPRRFASVP